jgi:hypothetical protein
MLKRVLAAIGTVLACVLVLFDVIPWRCPVAALAGIPCPTCGVTRAVRAALHGETWSAFRLHPLWTFVVIIVGAIAVAEIASFIQSGGFHDYVGRSVLHRAGLGLSVLLFLLWAIRFLGAFGGPAAI